MSIVIEPDVIQEMSEGNRLDKLLGEIIARNRDELGLSQEQLAHEAGIDRTFVGRVEGGKHSPSVRSLFKIAKGLRTTPDALVRELQKRIDE